MSVLILDIIHATRVHPCLVARRVRESVATLEHVLHCILSGSIACTCVTDQTMRKLNKRYRGKDRTTDVLSFLYSDRRERETRTIVGDIILSPRVAARQAKERKLSVTTVMNELVVHGFLHLLGYDHERSASDAKIMFGLQEKILKDMKKKI